MNKFKILKNLKFFFIFVLFCLVFYFNPPTQYNHKQNIKNSIPILKDESFCFKNNKAQYCLSSSNPEILSNEIMYNYFNVSGKFSTLFNNQNNKININFVINKIKNGELYKCDLKFNKGKYIYVDRDIHILCKMKLKEKNLSVKYKIKNVSNNVQQFNIETIIVKPLSASGLLSAFKFKNHNDFDEMFYLSNNKYTIVKKLKNFVYNANAFGVKNKYFFTSIFLDSEIKNKIFLKKENEVKYGFESEVLNLIPKKTKVISYNICCDSLAQTLPTNLKPINISFFNDIIIKPFLYLFFYIYKYVASCGLSIILVTILLKIIFLNVTAKSFRTSQKINSLDEQVNILKKKYEVSSSEFIQERYKLYKKNNIKPLLSTLPMLLQLPFFIIFYKIIDTSLFFKGSSFVWVDDLSTPDPFYIFPLLMIVSTFIVQKTTPTPVSKNQQMFLYLMPIVMGVIFSQFPSGLVLYWFINNVLTIIQNIYLIYADK